MSVSEAGWVDTSGFRPNAGQFPIRVERHLNRFVGAHLPGVTTVTNATRYYALHGLIAKISQEEDLDENSTVVLLRRTEALLAFVTRVHSSSAGHDGLAPAPHGIDAIVALALTSDGLDLARAAEVYAKARWGFSGAYRGSELTLGILEQRGFAPGPHYDDAARSVLFAVVEAVRSGSDTISTSEAESLSAACLCTTSTSADGIWLARLLSGNANTPAGAPTVGGLLWQVGRMTTVATTVEPVTGYASLADAIMFSSELHGHADLSGMVAPSRWRGALLRKESVHAWRLLWLNLNNRLADGAMPVTDLVESFVEQVPPTRVADFLATIPSRLHASGLPRGAERDLGDRPDLERWLAKIALGAQRLEDLSDEELHGFVGRDERRHGVWEELSPGWAAGQFDAFSQQTLQDLARSLANSLIMRSQRVALQKSRYDHKKQVLIYPARLHVRDGVAVKVFGETAPEPATRLPQYLSIARQAGVFQSGADGLLSSGTNGGDLA